MSESIKWSETNVGKYSMFDVELGEIKTKISCDTENSKKLTLLLKELEHTHISMNEENERLKKEVKSSIILSEAKKNTLALIRKQIDEILDSSSRSITIDNFIDQQGGMKELEKLCKQGFQQKEVAKKWGISSPRISMYIHKNGKSWKDLK